MRKYLEFLILFERESPRAVDDYEQNIAYLIQEWQQREVNNFVSKVTQTIANIQLMPEMYPTLEGANVVTRKAVVVKQISLIYTFDEDRILLLNFWNNYKDPESLEVK